MAKKSTCKKKHIEDLDSEEMENFVYRYDDDQIWLNPISIWRSLRKAGVPELADSLMTSVAEALSNEIDKKKKEKKDC